MQLKTREFDSKGKHYVNYLVKKMDEEGYGLVANKELGIELSFDIRVQRTPWTDPTGVSKTIVNVIATGKPSIAFDNVEVNQYGSATFSLPEKFADTFANAKKGDTLFVALKTFEKEIDGKMQKRSTWIGEINKHLDLTEKKDNRVAAPVGTVVAAKIGPKGIDAVVVQSQAYPADIQKVIKFCLSDSASFKESFGVADSKTKPQDFIDWMKSNDEVTTKLDDGQLIVLYWDIVGMIK